MNRVLRAVLLVGIALEVATSAQEKVSSPPPPGPARLEQLVEANIVAVHAYQILLARKQSNMDPACWPVNDPKEPDLQALVAHQTSLLSSPAAAKRWALGAPSTFDPAKDLQPLVAGGIILPANLPINMFTVYLRDEAPHHRNEEIRAVANLYQTVLEVERDGDRLQDLLTFYIALGLPVYVGQLGLPGSNDDFLATGRLLEGRACASPVGLSATDWQIAGRKIWNWGEKNLHIRDAQVLADELLAEPDVRALEPRIKALPAQRIAMIGHSFTMDLHWASPSAFVPIVTAMFARENLERAVSSVSGRRINLIASSENFLSGCSRLAPGLVLLVLINRTDQDLADLRRMGRGFKSAGARVVMFDDVHDPDSTDSQKRKQEAEVARCGRHRDRDGQPNFGRVARPQSLPLPGSHSHDGTLPSPDGKGVAQGHCRRATD